MAPRERAANALPFGTVLGRRNRSQKSGHLERGGRPIFSQIPVVQALLLLYIRRASRGMRRGRRAKCPRRSAGSEAGLAHAGKLWLGFILAAASLTSCIKREPRPEAPVEAAPAVVEDDSSSKSIQEMAALPATGKFGQVQGVDMLGGKGVRAFQLQGNVEGVEAKLLPVEGQPFSEMIRTKTTKATQNTWDVQIRASSAAPVERGDALLFTMYFRTEASLEESGQGQSEFVFEQATDPWTKSVTYPVGAAAEWTKMYVPFLAQESYEAGAAQLAFRLGYAPQTIEFAGLQLVNYGKDLTLADLPRTQVTYPGSAEDAPWRAEAQARIEKIRKAPLTIRVQDASGKPVAGATVRAQLVRNDFDFGTCAPAALLLDPKQKQFQEVIPRLFNMVTLENDLKWQPLAGEWGGQFTLDRAKAAVKAVEGWGLDVRGHVLVWPGWQNLPAKLKLLEKDKPRLRKEVADHIREVAGAVKGNVVDWDVVNEPFTNHDLLDILGPEVMVDWFKLTRKIDPKARLFINDFAILSGGGGDTAHRDHYEKMIQLLSDQHAPFDGIGMQGHFADSLTGPEDMLKILDRFAKFGKPILITEYDVVTDDEDLAAKFTRDFYLTMFSHEAVRGIVMWGFWDAVHWKKNAPIYRQDWSEKPSGKVYEELLKEWTTDASGQSDAQGVMTVNGFLGSYELSVTHAGATKKVKGVLKKGGSTVVVNL
nr:cellobiohydrolase [uncultured bacterium]